MGLALEKLPDWPAALNRDEALSFMRIAPKLFDAMEKSGTLTGKKLGKNGEKVYLAEHCRQALDRLFGPAALDIDDEIEGLNG